MVLIRFLFLLIVVAYSSSLFSQDHTERLHKIESLREQLRTDSAHIFRHTKWKGYLKIENRRTFINHESIRLYGGMIGAAYRDRHIFCGGYYFLNPESKRPIHILEDNYTAKQYLRRMEYFNISYQFILYNTRYLQINLPVELGYGLYHLNIRDSINKSIRNIDGDFVPIGAGAQFILKPVRWMGISFLGGYRYIQEQEERELKLNFKGWFYTIGIWADARHIARLGKYYRKKQIYKRRIRELA